MKENKIMSSKNLSVKLSCLLLLVQLFNVNSVFATEGSGARGGGDPLALEFKATASVALQSLRSMKGAPFNTVNLGLLQTKINTSKIIVTDQPLNISVDGFVQVSAAENDPSQNLIIINRKSYEGISGTDVQQALALHEFLSLMGVESTANYPISSQFLIAKTGDTAANAIQAISAAASSLAISHFCAEPSSDVATLFSMIATPRTPLEAVKSYVETHAIGWDVFNDQCQTAITSAAVQKRYDIFEMLYDYYRPDPSEAIFADSELTDLLGLRWATSIYASILESADVQSFKILKMEAKKYQQTLALDPVYGKVWTQYGTGTTELMVAATHNHSVAMIGYLIQTDGEVNATTSTGITALSASIDNSAAIVSALINAKADVNVTNDLGFTPLMNANQPDVVSYRQRCRPLFRHNTPDPTLLKSTRHRFGSASDSSRSGCKCIRCFRYNAFNQCSFCAQYRCGKRALANKSC
jgi:hypothetical protein